MTMDTLPTDIAEYVERQRGVVDGPLASVLSTIVRHIEDAESATQNAMGDYRRQVPSAGARWARSLGAKNALTALYRDLTGGTYPPPDRRADWGWE